MQKIRAIHIDDDQETLLYCKGLFNENKLLEYVSGFSNAKDAVQFLSAVKVDIIFCDIEMPEYNGFWLANNLPYEVPIVFITAHNGFAVEAFEACALHYLIKPLSSEQLSICIDRFQKQEHRSLHLKEQLSQFYNNYLPQNAVKHPSRIYINNIGKIVIVELQDLMYLIGSGNYTKFVMVNNEIYTSSKNLKVYEDALTHHPDFIRIHHSHLINKNFAKQILKVNNQQWFVEMKDNEKLGLSKGRLDEILEQLQK